jgi:hypothetical protein
MAKRLQWARPLFLAGLSDCGMRPIATVPFSIFLSIYFEFNSNRVQTSEIHGNLNKLDKIINSIQT